MSGWTKGDVAWGAGLALGAVLLGFLVFGVGCSSSRLDNYGNTADWPRAEPSEDAKRMEFCRRAGRKDC
jgi:hypothetical protein